MADSIDVNLGSIAMFVLAVVVGIFLYDRLLAKEIVA